MKFKKFIFHSFIFILFFDFVLFCILVCCLQMCYKLKNTLTRSVRFFTLGCQPLCLFLIMAHKTPELYVNTSILHFCSENKFLNILRSL